MQALTLLTTAVLITATAYAAEAAAITAFSKGVDDYVKIRDASKGKVPGLPKDATPEQIERHEQALVREIRSARVHAKAGDIFKPEIQPLFRKILKENFAGPENKEARAVARQGNPARDLEKGETAPVIQVNAVYPKNAPMSSVPPLLLLQLPKLPQDCEYRFSGQTLILWDSLSNLIIDYMKGAAPAL